MASIIKRKKNYSIVYTYVDENGETKQKWETRTSYQEALKRKAEIENQQHTGTFLPPSNQTITEFLYDFVSLYGEKKWGVSMYCGNRLSSRCPTLFYRKESAQIPFLYDCVALHEQQPEYLPASGAAAAKP